VLIVDAEPIVAAADRRDPRGGEVLEVLRYHRGPLIMPAPVTAEIDYLLHKLGGRHVADSFVDDLAAGRFQVECLKPLEYRLIGELSKCYAALEPGLADLSVVLLARRYETVDVLTFDQRHFRTMVPLEGGDAFRLLPDDAVQGEC